MRLPPHNKRNAAIAATAASLLAVAFFAYHFRIGIKDFVWRASQETVPEAMTAEEARLAALVSDEMTEARGDETAATTVETKMTTIGTESAIEESVDKVTEKSNDETPTPGLPKEINLAVPMVYQAPLQVWDALHEDACEEASMLMAQLFNQGKKAPSREEMDRLIKEIVDYETSALGHWEDTTAEETARVMRDFLGLKGAVAVEVKSLDDIRWELAAGRPVIIPAYGKALKNPNFRNGGPDYHMLVLKGYTATKIIANDPGTRRGSDYQYDPAVVWSAVHDWNDGKVTEGKKMMVVVR
jgi:hypothetical protein